MISLSRAARVPGEGLSPDESLSGSVCMFAASVPGREGAGLGCAAGGWVVPDVPGPLLSVMLSSTGGRRVAGVIVCLHRSPDGRCGACRVGVAGQNLLGHSWWRLSHVDFGGPCLIALGPPCRVRRCVWWCVRAFRPLLCICCGLGLQFRYATGAPTALISVSAFAGPLMVRVVPVWWCTSLRGRKP